MFAKLALANVRKSARDFAVYFFTLVLGVAVFYAFNSIADSSAVAQLSEDGREMVQLLGDMIGGVSVFVAVILGFLVLYANAFLIRRRRAEFGMYLTLGMGKGDLLKISACETLIVGASSLAVGLLVGIALSQLLSNVCASMMVERVDGVSFALSAPSLAKTAAAFAVIFVVSVVWNSAHLAKSKLIDLLAGSRKNDDLRMHNVPLLFALFVASLCIIGYSYSMLLRTGLFSENNIDFLVETLLVCSGTVLLFFSLSGFLLRVAQLAKPVYLRGLNMVFLRQLASRVNSTFVSMSVIAMALFLALTSVCGGIGIVNAMQSNAEAGVRCDASMTSYYEAPDYVKELNPDIDFRTDAVMRNNYDVAAGLSESAHRNGFDLSDMVSQSAQINFYATDIAFETLREITGESIFDSVGAGVLAGGADQQRAYAVRLSDFNAARTLCGLDPVELGDSECLLWCDFATTQPYMRKIAAAAPTISLFGCDLKVQGGVSADTIECTSVSSRTFEVVVSDSVIDGACLAPDMSVLDMMVKPGMQQQLAEFIQGENGGLGDDSWPVWEYQNADSVRAASHGMTALVSYLAIYIGFVMVVACAAILAIQQLSDASDNARRYELLLKLGAPHSMVSGALFKQVLVCFAFPLMVAIAHTLCAMQVVGDVVLVFGNFDLAASAVVTTAVFLAVYGAYFLATYLGARAIVLPSEAKRGSKGLSL